MTHKESNHLSNRVESRNERGRLISQIGSNHCSSLVETLVESGQIMTRTGSKFGSNRV